MVKLQGNTIPAMSSSENLLNRLTKTLSTWNFDDFSFEE